MIVRLIPRTVYNSLALTTKKRYLVVDVSLLWKTELGSRPNGIMDALPSSPGVDSKWFSRKFP